MTRVIVHIDCLVLRGFRPEDRHAVGQGLQAELERVLSGRDAASRLRGMGDVPRMQVSGVPAEKGASPQRVGEGVAQGIGREISP
ncbi:hypothetical protein [Polaromonas sp.]|uniref:hypothetical protein n=1 Tax=Polaromonas sp. TaxID=1869339 RepID=UPI0013B6B7C9|nr:hypothetical protein [Polaromonas sp.]NDP63661.1 hypothetical protein [Polaromonas sp.]